ncbi:hypothetical protein BJ875DRAFT_237929 [Amylocarpus encephaloides]|uniref:Uncharacterized protein n=1 Tax=Amylocarpus encephaloides TaxID=45428 RepID=A0A9P7YNG5_9HELO|nr:hypothetical protein BJ875DRAFT_237929 [Amylocarpus encephaloides]
MTDRRGESIVRLGPRIPSAVIGFMGEMGEIAVPRHVVEPRSPPSSEGSGTESSSASTTSSSTSSAASSSSSCGANACETGVSSSSFTMPIILGVAIPIIGAAVLFFVLHRRHVRKQREEDANDRHASLDFGLGDVAQPGRKNRPAMTENEMLEKELGRKRQISMDMGMNSPYLLPPELQNSRESLHSLSRTIHQHEDPYRPVTQYYPGDGHSLHSGKNGSSIYTGSSAAPSRMQEVSTTDLTNMPRNIPPAFIPPPRQNSLPNANGRASPMDPMPVPPCPVEPQQARIEGPGSPEDVTRNGLPTTPRPGQGPAPSPISPNTPRDARAGSQDNSYLGGVINATDPAPRNDLERPQMPNALPSSPRPPRKDSRGGAPPANADYGDGFKVIPPSPNQKDQIRGQRYSMDVPPEEFAQAGLGAPGFDANRLSMGFRPLPPDAVTESDDPEIRANRIRSFYKEYFDDSKPEPAGQYYEDYDENYLGDAAYYDPDSNAFVMPYAEPVTRRAMTPPPRGPKFMGPPRAMHGSMGGMSAGGRPRGPPPGPRAYSSASGRMGPPGQKPRKPMPPPAALNTMPAPSKLKDDSFAIFNANDFAPPPSIRERAQGRSQSPFGERRPYSPTVPAFAPTASAFEELAPMPSPHLLRKSGTFTGLDFAPPKRIKDPDTMSDSGSIRSNRSGISQVQLSAIRQGAYRASRIPKDVVFAKDDIASQLKPSWGMRPGAN